jgi:hypothetical protein
MKLSRAKAFTSIVFIAFCLLFSYQLLIFAQQPETNIPTELQELLQGKSSDFCSAASMLKETDLPAALAVVDLLKFKSLHQEIHASIDQINDFETQIKSRLEKSSVVSFSKTDTCRKKIEAKEIEVAGQKLVIPEFYIADIGLAITGVIPNTEAGTMFPVIQIDVFSQTEIAEYCLKIDNKEVPTNKISLVKNGDELSLIFCPDLDANNAFSIGTHTAEISLTNAAGEITEREWSFTVGVYDVSTQPLPQDAVAIKEIIIKPELIGKKAAGQLIAVVYKDKAGRIYTRYRLVKPSGSSIESGNLAFVVREMTSKSNLRSDLVILPGITLALEGHTTTFSYELNGPGDIYSVKWQINGEVTPVPTHTFKSNTRLNCEINATVTVDSGTEFHVVYKATKFIELLTVSTTIYGDRAFYISSQKPFRFDLKSKTIIPTAMDIELAEGESFQLNEANSGVVNSDAMLKVIKLRWKIVASEGPVEIEKPVASCTGLIFSDYGCAEVTKDIEFILSERGEVQMSSFKPETSALYAFYPVEGRAELEKVYPGQLVNTRRSLTFKRIEFKIKGQQRIIQNEAGCNLENPVILCKSVLWPASSPLEIKSVLPIIATENPVKDDDSDDCEDDDDDDGDDINSPILEYISRFNFYTRPWPEPCQKQLSCYAMFMPWELPDDSEKSIESDYGISFISPLPPMPVFKAENVLELKLEPSQPQKIPDGMVVEFKAAMTPRPGLGEGVLSDAFSDVAKIDVLDGYKISEFKGVEWLEDAAWLSDDDWGSGRIRAKGKYSHIFNPVKGIGSYTMRCRFDFKLKESITDDSCPALPETGVPVEALPDLRILSPINKLVYPLGVSVKVTTTMDKNADLWRQIKWTLNGKPYEHGLQEPPFEIKLDHEGEFLIEAQLNIAHPITGLDIPLSSLAKIVVQPLTIAFDPAKKVVKFKQNNGVPLKLMVKAGDFEAKTVKEPFLWHKSGQQAFVDSVEWAFFKEPDACVSADLNTLDLQKELNFSKPGAATVLATTTLRLADAKNLFKQEHKDFPNDVFEEPVFTFPGARSDLWAVKIGEATNIEKHFPEKSIAKAYRTYEVKSFAFDFESGTRSKKPHTYTAKDGLDEPISLKPAFSGIDPLSASIIFKWQVISDKKIEKTLLEPTKMVIKPTEVCSYEVAAELDLDFGCSALKLGEISVSAKAFDLFTLISTKVEPSSFTIALGDSRILRYVVSSLENNPPPTDNSGSNDNQPTPSPDSGNDSGSVITFGEGSESNILYLLDKSYALSIEQVLWSYEQDSPPSDPVKNSIESNPYNFQANIPGDVKGQANGSLKLSEILNSEGNEIGQSSGFYSNALWNTHIVLPNLHILVNNEPVGQQEYYLGQKITLSYRLETVSGNNLELENQSWIVSGAKVKAYNPLVFENDPRPCKATTLNDGELATKSVDVFLYCLEDENYEKYISISGNLKDRRFSASATIKIEHPTLVAPIPELSPANLSYYFEDGYPFAIYYIGYKDKRDSGDIGEIASFDPTISNQTKINYLVGAVQLVSNNHWRKFKEYDENGNSVEKEEVCLTLPQNKKWLDYKSLYHGFKSSPSGKIVKISDIYVDTPRVECDSPPKFVQEVIAEAEYTLIFMAKPSARAIPYDESIWVPIKAFTWGWGGHALKQPDATWSDEGHSVYSYGFFPEKLLEIVEWEFVANDDTLKWRPKHEF